MRPADTITINEMSAPPETLHIADAESPFGLLLLGATEIGLSHLWLNEDGRALQRMRATFPRTQLVRQSSPHHHAAMSYFSDNPRALNLHLKGTPFQISVWRALLDIPLGETSSYKHIAARIGKPNANRAVGSAVGKNPVFFIIPCHRVLAYDGGIGGYFWGTEVKQTMLGWEAARA